LEHGVIDVGIIAALYREIAPLVRGSDWRSSRRMGPGYQAYEHENVLLVCSGIGGEPARKTAEALIASVSPSVLLSVGLAGALTPTLKAGSIFFPAMVLDAATGSLIDSSLMPEVAGFVRSGVLVSASGVVSPESKHLLAAKYDGDAVDMEAASVAQVAAKHGARFLALKAISDEYNFPMPDLCPYIDPEGRFLTGRFVLRTALRPSTWPVVGKLASNSGKAAQELSAVLRNLLDAGVLCVDRTACESRNRSMESSLK
jgi:adenosylhomocysteine nucleosidase